MVDVLTVNEQPVYLVIGQTPLGPASGDLSGYYPGPTVSQVAGVIPGAEGLLLLAAANMASALAALGISPSVAAGDATTIRGVGVDGSPFAFGSITGVPGFGVGVPRSRFTGCTYPQSLFFN
jgi:hypothetical protein